MNATLAYQLHASLMLAARKRASEYAQQARTDRQLNQDQVDYVMDCAYDARKDAYAHLQAAKRAKLIADFAARGMAIGKYLSHAGIRYEA